MYIYDFAWITLLLIWLASAGMELSLLKSVHSVVVN
jgi:hypothetical protein